MGQAKTQYTRCRSGCVTCKTRRIKCDETKPACQQCIRSRRSCEYIPVKTWIFHSSTEMYADGSPSSNLMLTSVTSSKLGHTTVPLNYVEKLMNHAHTYTWMQLLAVYPDTFVKTTKKLWVDGIATSSALFHANMYGFGKHFRVCRAGKTTPEEDVMHLAHHTKALALASQEIKMIQATGSNPSDELLTTVLTLASYNFNVSPGVKVMQKSHHDALFMLVKRKGGLSAIETPGIAGLIFLLDLFRASIEIRVPWYPLQHSSTLLSATPRSSPDGLRALGLDYEMARAVDRLQKLLLTIDSATNDERTNALTFADLVIARIEIQHNILSLSPRPTKTALLIFSDFTTFPLPISTNTRLKLASLLKMQLLPKSQEQPHDPTLSLWMLVMGGIVSHGPQRDWFVLRCLPLCSTLGVSTLDSIRKALQAVTWSDEAMLKPPATAFWVELLTKLSRISRSPESVRLQIEQRAAEYGMKGGDAMTRSRSASLLLTWAQEYVIGK